LNLPVVLLLKELMAVLFSRAETLLDYKNTAPPELALSSPDWSALRAVFKRLSLDRSPGN
jgi:hypothetical protein